MIDWDRIAELEQTIGPDAFAEVARLFLEEVDEATERLTSAKTAREMQDYLHALKGAALNLGFTDLAHLSQICESRAEAGETDLPLAQVAAVYATSRAAFLQRLTDRSAQIGGEAPLPG